MYIYQFKYGYKYLVHVHGLTYIFWFKHILFHLHEKGIIKQFVCLFVFCVFFVWFFCVGGVGGGGEGGVNHGIYVCCLWLKTFY